MAVCLSDSTWLLRSQTHAPKMIVIIVAYTVSMATTSFHGVAQNSFAEFWM